MTFPLLIVRQMCGVHGKRLDFMRELLEINRKYPGSCDEYWILCYEYRTLLSVGCCADHAVLSSV